MSKVFEALQRQQQNEKNKEAGRDPLAAEVGTPDAPAGNGNQDEAGANFESPLLIGTPTGPRSNEGMILPSFKAPPEDQRVDPQAATPRATNGRSHIPAIRRPQPEAQPEQAAAPQSEPVRQREASPAPNPREIPVEQISATRLHPRLILLSEPQLTECEQYRTLRTELFHAASKRPIQVVMVTSALAGEGKTSTVLNLAVAIAQSKEKRVLVIDGDLRRPNIASYLGLRPTNGLSEILGGECDAFSSIFCIDGEEIYVLPGIRESSNPTEMLSSERFGETLALLRGYFDFILVDSPPVMPFADSRLLANHADAVILVVRAGMSPYEIVEKSIDALPRERLLGVVLNGAEHLKEAGYYDYYYNYARREQRKRTLRQKVVDGIRNRWIGRKMRL